MKLNQLILSILVLTILSINTIDSFAQETYRDGDPYINEDFDDPNWVWNIETSNRLFGVENDFIWNDDSDNPAALGECINLPNNYVSICLDSLTTTDYGSYTIEYEDSADLSDAGGGTSEKAIYIHTHKVIGAISHPTREIWITGDGRVYYKNLNNNRVTFLTQLTGSEQTIAVLTNADPPEIEFNVLTENNNMYVNVNSLKTGDKIIAKFKIVNNEIYSLGNTRSYEEADELQWFYNEKTVDIGTKDEDHRSLYGIIIRDPKSHGASDEVGLDIPNKQIKANLLIKGYDGSEFEQEVKLGSSFTKTLTKNELNSLQQKSIYFGNKYYLTHEELQFPNEGIKVVTSLSTNEDDYQTDVFLELNKDAMKYNYIFDDYIDFSQVSSSNPLEIDFLKEELSIIRVGKENAIIVGGPASKYKDCKWGIDCFLNSGDTALIDGNEIKLMRVGSAGAIVVDVNGYVETIPASTTEEIKGISIWNKETYYDPYDQAASSATIVATEKINETEECTDTDNGQNIYTKGTTTSMGYSATDYCLDNGKLKEFYCSSVDDTVDPVILPCPSDYECDDGACVEVSITKYVLSDYPNMFIKKNGKFYGRLVVGDICPASDTIAQAEILADLQAQAITETNRGTIINPIPSSAAVLDKEIKNLYTDNLIIISSENCNNLIKEFDNYIDENIPLNEAVIQLEKIKGKYFLFVMGNSRIDTRNAALAIITGKLKEITGKKAIVRSPTQMVGTYTVEYPISETPECEDYMCLDGTIAHCYLDDGECICETCKEIPPPTPIECKNGCPYKDKCLYFGYRIEKLYCDLSGYMEEQKDDEEACNNHFECESNICVNDQCLKASLIQKILDWFRRIFS